MALKCGKARPAQQGLMYDDITHERRAGGRGPPLVGRQSFIGSVTRSLRAPCLGLVSGGRIIVVVWNCCSLFYLLSIESKGRTRNAEGKQRMTKFNRRRSGGQDTSGDEEAPPTALPNSPSPSNESSVGNESEPGSSQPRNHLRHKLSAVSRMYDIDGDGVLNETEKAMRDLDGSDKGFISNSQVYRIMEQSLQLQHQVRTVLHTHIKCIFYAVPPQAVRIDVIWLYLMH